MHDHYKTDLAWIHDVGFSAYALNSAPAVLAELQRARIRNGLIVELGCGSGLLSAELAQAGYEIFGLDISPAMIALARKRVPQARFQVASLFNAEVPACQAVVSVGECLNYLFDPSNGKRSVRSLFQRVWRALAPGGLFIFDIAEPGQVSGHLPVRSFTLADGWAVLLAKQEDRDGHRLTRQITTFRRSGKHYRRTDEVHELHLYQAGELAVILRRIGFRVRMRRSYGAFQLPPAHMGLMARKPVR